MRFSTLFKPTHITADIALLLKATNSVSASVSEKKNSFSKVVSNSDNSSIQLQNMGGMKSFDTAFVAYQMMGLG